MLISRKVYPSIYFGKYKFSEGYETLKYPLEWFVLDIDEVNNKMLLLSKLVVDWKYLQIALFLGKDIKLHGIPLICEVG